MIHRALRHRLANRVLRRYAAQLDLPLGEEDLQGSPQAWDEEDDDYDEWAGLDDEDMEFEGDDRIYWGNEGAGILFRTPTRVLLMHRSNQVNEPGTWGVVGGAVEGGEDPKEAAHREAVEELGRVPRYRIVGKYVYEDAGFTYTTFIAMVDESLPETWRPRLNWENVDWAWIPNGEAKRYRLHFGAKPVLAKIGWR